MRWALVILFVIAVSPTKEIWAKNPVNLSKKAKCKDIFCTSYVLRFGTQQPDPKLLTAEQVDQIMRKNLKYFESCIIEVRRRDPYLKHVKIEFVISEKGVVLATRVNDKRKSSLTNCIHENFQKLRFPQSQRVRSVASFDITVVQ
ncbi:MAG: hypothetical protein V1754_13150 [Pseudomonadota bacterium]